MVATVHGGSSSRGPQGHECVEKWRRQGAVIASVWGSDCIFSRSSRDTHREVCTVRRPSDWANERHQTMCSAQFEVARFPHVQPCSRSNRCFLHSNRETG